MYLFLLLLNKINKFYFIYFNVFLAFLPISRCRNSDFIPKVHLLICTLYYVHYIRVYIANIREFIMELKVLKHSLEIYQSETDKIVEFSGC